MYTDKSPNVTTSTCVNLLELANRLCLPRLVTLVETSIIQLFTEHINAGEDISKEALEILQPCQVWFFDREINFRDPWIMKAEIHCVTDYYAH